MAFNLHISEILYLFAALQGVFLASLIVIRRSLKKHVFLFLLILLFTFYLLENVIYSSGYIKEVPHFYFTTLPLIYLIGPLFYLYIRSSLISEKLKWKDLIHATPFLFELIILLPFYLLDSETKIRVYEMSQQASVRTGEITIYFIGYLVYILSTLVYFLKSLRLIASMRHSQMKLKERRKFIALRSVSIGFFIYLFVSLVLTALSFTELNIKTLYFHVNLTSLTILIYAIGYVAFLSPSLLEKDPKSFKSVVDVEKRQQVSEKLRKLMNEDKLYLDASINAREISDRLGVSNYELSRLLNISLNTSFYDFINHHRIEHAKKMLLSKEFQNAKIFHIAIDSGFSSKSSFLRNFKKTTGLTPTEFKKSMTIGSQSIE